MSKYSYNIYLSGDRGVGKTAFMTRHATGNFVREYHPTHGIDETELVFHTNYGVIAFNVLDTAEEYETLERRIDGAILVYDLTRLETLDSFSRRINDFSAETPVAVCGNKCDLAKTSYKKESHIVRDKAPGCYYAFISALSNYNFEHPFLHLARELTGHKDLIIADSP